MYYHGWHLACQTYALNLIDSHGGQNRAPQLFSSSKSFCVAKSTPSSGALLAISSTDSSTTFLKTSSVMPSAIFSTKLSSISKWLLRPPLLFKLRLLFKPSLLSKSALFFAPLLLLSYTQGAQALSATTNNLINGTAPYLTFDGGQTKAIDTDTFLAIELPDGRSITPSTNTSSLANPIMVPAGITFNDIHMVLPLDSDSISLNDLITQGKWGDDDGDGQGAGGVTASGSISLVIKDKDGTTVSRGDTLNLCKAPYKVTLSSAGGNLVTQYGIPNSSTFSGGTVDYYITLPSQPVICSVRPNLHFGNTGISVTDHWGDRYDDDSRYAGPANIWSSDKGFLTVFTAPSSYNRNFPTTGMNELYFDLEVVGVDASQLRWSSVTHSGITATVSWTRPRSDSHQDPWGNNIPNDNWISDKSKYVTRVTLKGPRADSNQIRARNPSPLSAPSLPKTFELVGIDNNGNQVKYGFVLNKWFVNRGTVIEDYPDQSTWCNSLGYSVPQAKDLTNAVRRDGFPTGTTPLSPDNHYQRRIGAGFFTEWGNMNGYADAGFITHYYWVSDTNGYNRFDVDPSNGTIRSVSGLRYALCTTP